jgi:hypothetical protein
MRYIGRLCTVCIKKIFTRLQNINSYRKYRPQRELRFFFEDFSIQAYGGVWVVCRYRSWGGGGEFATHIVMRSTGVYVSCKRRHISEDWSHNQHCCESPRGSVVWTKHCIVLSSSGILRLRKGLVFFTDISAIKQVQYCSDTLLLLLLLTLPTSSPAISSIFVIT